MSLILLTPELIEAIHDRVLNAGELTGMAKDKSLSGALARVDHRLAYGLISDVYDLAAAYAMTVATGHCFNDGNKRTAHQSMDICLDLNGIQISWQAKEVGQMIIMLAKGQINDSDLADWLRSKSG